MSRMANLKIVDIDAELGDSDEVIHTKKIRLLGREWTIQCDLNTFAMSQIAAGDASGISRFISNLVIPEERDDFIETLSSAKNLSGERLGSILQKLIEVAGERPTEPPSPSLRTAKKPTSVRKSQGS